MIFWKGMNLMSYADYTYEIVKQEAEGLDAIYEDYLCSLIGVSGLNALIEAKLLETCGVINGRPLYVLCDKK